MPEINRIPVRMDCGGIDLVHPVDKMPPGYFPYLLNVRVNSEGRIDGRPGFTPFSGPAADEYHSLRRLNDEDQSIAPNGYIYVAGNGTNLQAGIEGALTNVDSGYSGKPLSLIPFRPDASPESWMYVYDENKQSKVAGDGTVRDIGVAPPPTEVQATYGQPAVAVIDDGQAIAPGGHQWLTIGDVLGGGVPPLPPILFTREFSSETAVTSVTTVVVYDDFPGGSGWFCVNVTTTDAAIGGEPVWAGPRMRIIIGGETCYLREIHPKIPATTLAGIAYDSGSTGLCTIVLASSPPNLTRNSLIKLNTEAVRVLSTSMSPDGSTYSIRCKTTGTHVAGEAVTGLTSWYCNGNNVHAAGEAVTTECLVVSGQAFGNNYAELIRLANIDASVASGRPISLSDDYMHISFRASNPAVITAMEIGIDIDQQTSTLVVPPAASTDAFSNNYILWTLSPSQIFSPGAAPTVGNITGVGAGDGSWNEIVVKLADGVRYGNDPTRTLATIRALKVKLYLVGITDFAIDWWYVFGTYGPEIQPSDPAGYLYAAANRDSSTGAASVIGPPTRFEMFPLREQVLISPVRSTQQGVDSIDIYRQGGTLAQPTYVGTVVNSNPPGRYIDNLPDSSIQSSPVADNTLIQPWPVIDLPWVGTVTTVGTRVTKISGTDFNVKLLNGQVILIGGVAYQVFGQPESATVLNLYKSAGVQTSTFEVQSPTLAAQPMPLVFGPLEGPFAPVVFGLGDTRSPGTLYYSNSANLDAASDKNTLEICAPSEPLISGASWNGIVIVGSRENIYLVRYTYQQTPLFQFQKLPSPSGIWARWACCAGQDGVYFVGRDGVYRATTEGVERVASPDPRHDPLYPLFPHDGQPATGTPQMNAIDMTALTALRLTAADNDIYFDYLAEG